MIVVSASTGQIGSHVVKHLLQAGEPVRVIARDPAKLTPEVRDRVEIIQGSHDHEATLLQALQGAESYFLVVPPSFTTTDDVAYYRGFSQPAICAVQACGVKRVVAVSALGRGIDLPAGPVTASLQKDKDIEASGVDYRALWCPSFMDNMLRQIEPLKHQGMFFMPQRGDLKAPHCATRDIASSAVQLLLDRSWLGTGGLAVLGPEDLSFNQQAEILSEVLGKPIRFQQISGEAYKQRLIGLGASEQFAQGLVEMHEAKDKGLDNAEPRTAENTTPTSFRQWCEDVLVPAMQR